MNNFFFSGDSRNVRQADQDLRPPHEQQRRLGRRRRSRRRLQGPQTAGSLGPHEPQRFQSGIEDERTF